MMNKSTIEQGIAIGDKRYWVTAEISWSHDPCYGADADGNRGIPVTTVEEIHIIGIIDTELNKAVKVTDELQDLFAEKLDI